MVSDSDWSCRFCGNPVALSTVTGLIEALETELGHIIETDYTVAALQAFVTKNSYQLHYKHYLNILGKLSGISIYPPSGVKTLHKRVVFSSEAHDEDSVRPKNIEQSISQENNSIRKINQGNAVIEENIKTIL